MNKPPLLFIDLEMDRKKRITEIAWSLDDKDGSVIESWLPEPVPKFERVPVSNAETARLQKVIDEHGPVLLSYNMKHDYDLLDHNDIDLSPFRAKVCIMEFVRALCLLQERQHRWLRLTDACRWVGLEFDDEKAHHAVYDMLKCRELFYMLEHRLTLILSGKDYEK